MDEKGVPLAVTCPEGLEGMIKPIDANGWVAFEFWLQRWPIERVKGIDGLTSAERQILLTRASEEAKGYWIGSELGTALMFSFAGVSTLWWLSRVLVEPSLTKEEARSEVNQFNLPEITNVILRVNGLAKGGDSDPTTGNQTGENPNQSIGEGSCATSA